MKKNTFFLLSLFLTIITLSSCDDTFVVEELPSLQSGIKVSKMSEWLPATRGAQDADEPVLQFMDEETYLATIDTLSKMSPSERYAFFEEIGFEGAYKIWATADAELDEIFELEDSTTFLNQVELFKEKYDSIFVYDESDPHDLTPYLKFFDANLALVGNVSGHVVVGGQLIAAEQMFPFYMTPDELASLPNSIFGPIMPSLVEFNNAKLSIKEGDYESTMKIGRITDSNTFGIKFETKKKRFWFIKKKVNTGHSISSLQIPCINFNNHVTCHPGQTIYDTSIPVSLLSRTFSANVVNFSSGACKNVSASRYFNSITVR